MKDNVARLQNNPDVTLFREVLIILTFRGLFKFSVTCCNVHSIVLLIIDVEIVMSITITVTITLTDKKIQSVKPVELTLLWPPLMLLNIFVFNDQQ